MWPSPRGSPSPWPARASAREATGDTRSRFEQLALDPLGPLHREPDRLLIEELPQAMELHPLLDAIGGGAHRASEIATGGFMYFRGCEWAVELRTHEG